MIITKLRGGLGNQMFQYAFGRSLALQNGGKLAVDISYYNSAGPRVFSLKAFNVKYDRLLRHPLGIWLRAFIGRYRTLREVPFYESIFAEHSGNVCLDGHWESYKFFAHAETAIREDFTLRNPSAGFRKYAAAVPAGSVSVHVRRGDYLTPHGKYLNSKKYYDKAVALIIQKKNLTNPRITIFSDDREWCKEHLKKLGGCDTNIFEDASISDAEELILMSLHDNNVISNSTFSWWAAFLNRNAAKIIAAPSGWFTDPSVNMRYRNELVLPGWNIVE